MPGIRRDGPARVDAQLRTGVVAPSLTCGKPSDPGPAPHPTPPQLCCPACPFVAPFGVSALPSFPAGDGLGLEILSETLNAALPADPAALEATERSVGTVEHSAVDAEGAGADAPRDRHPAVGRPRHHRTRQTEDAVVGDPHSLVVVVERQEHQLPGRTPPAARSPRC